MAKKATGFVKLQVPAGKTKPAPPVGTALGPHSINIMAFCKEFNARTQNQDGIILHREDDPILILRASVELLAERHDVDAVRTERRTHRWRGVRLSCRHLQLHETSCLLRHVLPIALCGGESCAPLARIYRRPTVTTAPTLCLSSSW